MKKKDFRVQKISKEIKKKISIIFHNKIKILFNDLATISDVDVSKDLSHAKIFVIFYNDISIKKLKKYMNILQSLTGKIRIFLAKSIYFRTVPKISFVYDNSAIEGRKISNLIKKIHNKDKKLF